MIDDQSWAEIVDRWQCDSAFCRAFSAELASEPLAAFAWETVPVSRATRDRPFAQVVVDSPSLASAKADPLPFAAIPAGDDGIRVFKNLGGDATLVAPARSAIAASDASYAHLAAFLREGPSTQIDALWSAVGVAVARHWAQSAAPLWVSTAGLGVHWLHVRLDAAPKYYRHGPFRRFDEHR